MLWWRGVPICAMPRNRRSASTASSATAQKVESQPPWVMACTWASSCGAALRTQAEHLVQEQPADDRAEGDAEEVEQGGPRGRALSRPW